MSNEHKEPKGLFLGSALLVVLVCGACHSLAQQPFLRDKGGQLTEDANLHVADLGTSASPAVNSGFFFFNGEYVASPYVVSRKGLGVFINDRRVYRIHPKVLEPTPIPPASEPPMPADITTSSTLDDASVRTYVSSSLQYWKRNSPDDEIYAERAREIYRRLPFVTQLVAGTGPTFQVVTRTGEKRTKLLDLSTWRAEIRGAEMATRELERIRVSYYELFCRSAMYIYDQSGMNVTVPQADAEQYILGLARIAQLDEPPQAKKEAIRRLGMDYAGKSLLDNLAGNLRPTPQLLQRAKEIEEVQKAKGHKQQMP